MSTIKDQVEANTLTQDAVFVVDNNPNVNPVTNKITLAHLITNIIPGPYANTAAMLAANTVQLWQPYFYSNGAIVVRTV